MKTRLEQLTIAQFADLLSGEQEVLLEVGEKAPKESLEAATRDIVIEYRAIADPTGLNAYVSHMEAVIKAKMSLVIFKVCDNLIKLGQYTRVVEVLRDYGVDASGWSEARISGTVQAKLMKAEREMKELTEETGLEIIDPRKQFDSMTAALMAHFRFQIDPATIKATLYANLVARYTREVKAQVAAAKK